MRGPDLRRRAALHPLAAGPRGRHPVAGAVHPDRPRAWPSASPWARRSSSASRWPSARSSPGWSSGGRSSACARRPRRCRCATPSPCCSSSRSACSSTRRTCSIAVPLVAATLAVILLGKPLAALVIVLAAPLSAAGRARGRRRPGPDRRVLVHPRHARPRPRRPPGGGDAGARRGVDRLDHPRHRGVPAR